MDGSGGRKPNEKGPHRPAQSVRPFLDTLFRWRGYESVVERSESSEVEFVGANAKPCTAGVTAA
jgi:hypothetical protein